MPPFYKRLWQWGYYDRIIRGGADLAKTRRYISHHPLRGDIRQG